VNPTFADSQGLCDVQGSEEVLATYSSISRRDQQVGRLRDILGSVYLQITGSLVEPPVIG
jgi:hypothetical protein